VRVSKSGFKDQVITESFSGGERTLDVPPLVPVPHEGRLVIDAGGKGTIKVDDRIVGEGRWNGAVPSGPHSVRATAAGMRPYVASVTIEDGQTSTLTVPWTPESGSRLVWWVVGGGLAAAGLAYAGYRVFWPAPTASPEIGTLDPGTIQLPLRSH
jgi:hypothetical protein